MKLELKAEANPGRTDAGDGALAAGGTADNVEGGWSPGKDDRADRLALTGGVLETGNPGKDGFEETKGPCGTGNSEGTAVDRFNGN